MTTDPAAIAKVLASLLNYEPKLADSNYAAFVEELAAALRDSVKEERRYWQAFMKLNHFEDQSDVRKEARAEALEEAAKVAEKGLSQPGDVILCTDPRDIKLEELAWHIAKKIRALTAKGKTG